MVLLERLQKRANEAHQQIWRAEYYNQQAADDRSLLEQAIHYIRQLETKRVLDRVI